MRSLSPNSEISTHPSHSLQNRYSLVKQLHISVCFHLSKLTETKNMEVFWILCSDYSDCGLLDCDTM
jgi:hypothetical protein